MVLRPLSLSASMMRWKPSVSSCSAAASGFVATAASAMCSSPVSRLSCPGLTRASTVFQKKWIAGSSPAMTPNLLQSSAVMSVQIIRVFRHVLGEAERMISDEILGARGVAGFERLDDVHVVADRFLDAVLLDDGLATDHPHVGEQIFG